MVTVVAAAVALAAGVPALHVGAALLVMTSPQLFLVASAGWAVWSRLRPAPPPAAESEVLRLLAAELRSGSSLPMAVASADRRFPVVGLQRAARLAVAGTPDDVFGAALAERLHMNGALVGRAIAVGSRTGAPLAGLLERLAAHADHQAELGRELRAVTAQARLSALVVGGGPLAFTGILLAAGAVDAPWTVSGAAAVMTVTGVLLQATGLGAVWLLIRRHTR